MPSAATAWSSATSPPRRRTGRRSATVAASTTDLLARPLDALIDGTLNGCAMLVPRAVFDRIGRVHWGLPTTQDYHLWFRMAHRVPFVHVPSVDVLHRLHPGQGSRQPEHLDEAGQLYVHVLAAVPPRRMAAYAGARNRPSSRAVADGCRPIRASPPISTGG